MKTILTFCFTVLIFTGKFFAQWNMLFAPQTSTLSLGVNCISAPDVNVMWASTFDTTNTQSSTLFYKTNDGGISWAINSINTAPAMQIVSISAINKDTAWAAINKIGTGVSISLFFSKVLKTTDGGANWTQQTTASYTGPKNHINFIKFMDEPHGLCVEDSHPGCWEIYKTFNGGTNWHRIPSTNILANLTGEKGIENCYSVYNNTIWFGTNKGRIYKSIDFGNSWNTYTTPISNISNISMKDSLNGLASNGTTLIKTNDGGITWFVQPYNGVLFSADLCFMTGHPNSYGSCGWKSGDRGSSYTIDDGLNWITIDSIRHTTLDFTSYSEWSGGVTWIAADTQKYLFFYNNLQHVTGTFPIKKNDEIKIYPNPFSNELNFVKNKKLESITIEMYNALGLLVNKWTGQQEDIMKIHTESLEKGTYIFKT